MLFCIAFHKKSPFEKKRRLNFWTSSHNYVMHEMSKKIWITEFTLLLVFNLRGYTLFYIK